MLRQDDDHTEVEVGGKLTSSYIIPINNFIHQYTLGHPKFGIFIKKTNILNIVFFIAGGRKIMRQDDNHIEVEVGGL